MADRLLAVLEAPSLSFTCFHGHLLPIRISRKPSDRARISSTPSKLRFSPQLPFATSSSDPAPPSCFDLLHSTQLSDGSHVFRFGNASEKERNLEVQETISSVGMEEDIEHGGVSPEQETESGQFEISDQQGHIKSHHKRENTSEERFVQKEDSISPTTYIDVTETNDDTIVTSQHSFQADERQILAEHGDSTKVENGRASEVNTEHRSTAAVFISTADSKSEIASDIEEVSSSVDSQNTRVCEIAAESSASKVDSEINMPKTLKAQEDAEKKIGIKFKQITTIGQADNMKAATNNIANIDADKNYRTGQMTMSTLPEAESVLVKEATHETVDESTKMYRRNRPETAKKSKDDHKLPSSTIKEVIDGNIKSSDIAQVSSANGMGLKSNEVALTRDGISKKGFFLDSGVALLQHPSKALAGREDDYFIACQNWLGVADGVCQWSFEGIKPGVYAKELLNNCQKIVTDGKSVSMLDPVEVLCEAAAGTKSPGSCTILVAFFDDQALHVANIGDSGFIVIRSGTVLQRSSPMLHEFNFPLQITQGDDPSKFVEVYRVDLDEGDVIITATDGLFDNLYDQEISSIVSGSLHQSSDPQEIANSLAARAQEVGNSASARTPFADAAKAAGYVGYGGGKLDAVTVIVSLVRKR